MLPETMSNNIYVLFCRAGKFDCVCVCVYVYINASYYWCTFRIPMGSALNSEKDDSAIRISIGLSNPSILYKKDIWILYKKDIYSVFLTAMLLVFLIFKIFKANRISLNLSLGDFLLPFVL